MPDRRIQCPVQDLARASSNKEANAFRVLEEAGDTFFLDFIHYSPRRQHAEVIVRVRVHREALASMRDRLSNDMVEYDPSLTVVFPLHPVGMVN